MLCNIINGKCTRSNGMATIIAGSVEQQVLIRVRLLVMDFDVMIIMSRPMSVNSDELLEGSIGTFQS